MHHPPALLGHPGQMPEERRFAGTVGPDDGRRTTHISQAEQECREIESMAMLVAGHEAGRCHVSRGEGITDG